MIEHCERCRDYAPAWDHSDYAAWFLALSDDGAYLGVICPGCFHAFAVRTRSLPGLTQEDLDKLAYGTGDGEAAA